MNNNLKRIEKELRSFAKKCKDVKYNVALLFSFLVTGSISLTTNKGNSIETAKKGLQTSITDMKKLFREAKAENNKLMKTSSLELIQLMEQGDHVVKSPWSSWQFGMNYFYSDWRGTYKGRGDKKEKYPYEGVFTRSTDPFERYTSPESPNYGLLPTSTNPFSASTTSRSGLGSGYGIASTTPKQEPLTVMNVDASIRPKDVYRDPVTAPTVNISAPVLQTLNVPNLLPPSLDIKTPEPVAAPNKTPQITVNPTVEFSFGSHNVTNEPWANRNAFANQDGKGLNYYSGWKPGGTGPVNEAVYYRVGNSLGPSVTRISNVFYMNTIDRTPLSIKWKLIDAKVDVAGKPGWSPMGTSAIHTVWNGVIENVTGNLHGYSAFISSETWHSGQVDLVNVNVNVDGQYNSIFYGYPSSYYSIGFNNGDYNSWRQRGRYNGSLNATISAENNYIYTVLGVQGAFEIKSTGTYNINSNNNIGYLGLGYSPNWQNLKGSGSVTSDSTEMTPSIQLSKTNVNGNKNAVLYFGNRYGSSATPHYDGNRTDVGNNDKWAKSIIGIYQGEIDVNANIGTTSNSKGNVGVYSKSGQRIGIVPTKDLGAPDSAARATQSNKHPDYDLDKVHNLEIGAAKIYFGKYSTDGVMFASESGTVMDIGKAKKADKNATGETDYKEIGAAVAAQTEIRDAATDLTSSYDDTANQAATGTVVAYSTGVWNNTDMPGGTAAGLTGKPSEINLYKPVVMTGRAKLDSSNKLNRSVALIGDSKGVVNAEKKVTALGYSSIVALAQNNGVVNAKGDIVAKDGAAAHDDATKPYLYNNIGAYAGANGTVNVTGNADIYGIGAMASGSNAVANLNGSANTIRTGKSGALVAINGGVVNFGGGTITHSENLPGDHDSSTPFNADSTSHINFTGATILNISHGVLIPGTAADYEGTVGTSKKYNGMSNVTVNLTGDNVVLASNNGIHKIWDGTTIQNLVQTAMKVAAFNTNGHSYKIYYINGQFDIDSNIDVGSASDDFNKVGLSREIVTINAGKTVSSTVGKGLAMGSNNSANTDGNNSKTQFINNGIVDIQGGTLAAGTMGLNISYGQIHNNNIINVNEGIGAYGINGSTLTNEATGTINVTTQGIGMAAFTSAGTLQTYGTDKKITDGTLTAADKTFEIINKGQITVNGNKSVGLYGDTNGTSGLLSSSNGSITNNGKLTLTGDEAVGIVSKRATVNLTGTGSSDIVVGKKGIGVYAEKSPVRFNSDYGVEVKDGGTGVFVKNDGSNIIPSGSNTLELKYSGSNAGTGVGLFYEGGTGANLLNTLNVKLTDTVGTTEGLVGVYTAGGGKLTNNAKITGDKGYGIISNGAEVENTSDITLTNPLTASKPSVGILTQAGDKITNTGTVTVGDNSVGIFGKEIVQKGTISVGNDGTGLYSEGGNVTLDSGSTINTGANKAVGVFTKGAGQVITATAGSAMTIGDSSFGFLNEGTGNTINSNVASQTLGNDGTYIYSSDTAGVVNNNTALTSTGSYNYGLYSAGTVTNNADINFGSGMGNVGIYSTHGGTATNLAGRSVTVGASYIDPNNSLNNRYAVGMAAGFNGDGNPAKAYTGNVVNEGTINVTGPYSIGMYGTEAGTKVYNGTALGSTATINLGASNTTGMYLDNGAYGYNYGTIQSTGSGLKKVVGVVVKNGSTIENHGKIELNAEDAVGILSKGNAAGANPGIVKNYGTFNINGVTNPSDPSVIKESSGGQDLGKGMGGVRIDVPAGSSVGTITINGQPVVPTLATTSAEEYRDMQLSKIGMYIDTSNKRFTNPINGLSALSNLTSADLIMGNEAAENTTSKAIQVDQKILEPYNKMIKKNPQIKKWNIYSGSLTWMATITQNQTDGTMQNAYLAKVPYTHWAGNEPNPVEVKDTYNFLDGLEQRYGVEELGSRENQLFQKLNSIGNNEETLFYQAVDEMMGHQYANVQQRTYGTGRLIDKEITHLAKEWDTKSKQSNKIKVFGMRDEYSTDTAGIIDYTSNAYGFAYLHEDETVKLGNSSGWYAGAVHNRFRFKDIGKSKENQTMLKLGIFKTMSPATDHNGSLQWTISGEGYVSRNDMHRKYLVVDEIFNAKSDYTTYGVALKNELGYNIRTSERTSIRPYGSLKLEYGRFGSIKEKSGEIRLEVEGNDYYSVKPEVGIEFKYKQPMAVKTTFVTSLGLGYENELGRVGNVKNKARVAYTDADWFNIRGEKDDRKGNFKADLNLGIENQRVGVTFNAGYDTKGKNVRGGLGFRVIY